MQVYKTITISYGRCILWTEKVKPYTSENFHKHKLKSNPLTKLNKTEATFNLVLLKVSLCVTEYQTKHSTIHMHDVTQAHKNG